MTLTAAGSDAVFSKSSEARHLADKLEMLRSFSTFGRGEGTPSWPQEVFLEVSNVCDLKCVMCTYFSAISPQRFNSMRASARGFFDVDASADNLSEILRHSLVTYCFGFGEPTIHPQFREFLGHVLQFETLVDFFTNGMHLTPDLGRFLVDHRVHCVTVSLSGATKEDYENVYLGGKFERVLQGIRNITDYRKAVGSKYPRIAINSVSFRHHIEKLDCFVDLMADCGVDSINVKQLVPYSHIPELYRHASILRPWEEGVMVSRAEVRARERGITLALGCYGANAVQDEVEYQQRLASWKGELGENSDFPHVSIQQFADVAKNMTYARPAGDALSENEPPPSEKRLRVLHDIGPVVPEGNEPGFYCMEPFKTMYVRRNGEVKPCCFGRDDAPFLGNVKTSRGVDVWRGGHYETVRTSIVDGEYPRKLCSTCLQNKLAPPGHLTLDRLVRYAEWWADRFGSPLAANPEYQEVWADLVDIGESSKIVERFRSGNFAEGAPARLELVQAILTVVRSFPRVSPELNSLVDGYCDSVTRSVAKGWVWSPMHPQLRLPVAAWVGDVVVAEGIAGQLRPDLRALGKGDGRYGFVLRLDRARVPTDAGVSVRVTVGRTPCELYDSPRVLD
jgi:MoaA/NifB/PqqE/SkfB family radical SAM enzyme